MSKLRKISKPLVTLLIVLIAAPSAWAGCSGPPPMLGDLLQAVTQENDVVSQIPTGFTRSLSKLDRPLKLARMAAISSQAVCNCAGSSAVGSCLAGHVDKQFLCDMLDATGLPSPTNPFSVMSVFFPAVGVPLAVAYEVYYGDEANPFCAAGGGDSGGSANHFCCQRAGMTNGCVYGTAPDHIDCLGSPKVGTYLGPGSLDERGNPWCGQIPECVPGSDVADQSNFSKAERLNQWTNELSDAYADAVYGSGESPSDPSSCTADFAMMIGCQGFFEVLRQGQPFHGQGGEFERLEMATAAQRVIYGVPNGVTRYDYVKSRIWTAQQKAVYLNGVNARAELRQWLSPCGFELLQASLPRHWELLAVPAPGEQAEEPVRDPALWVDGCLQGKAPSGLTARVTQRGQTLVVDVEVSDPEAGHAGGDIMPLSIRWGAKTVTGEIFRHGQRNTFTHTYTESLPSSLGLGYVNGAGFSLMETVPVP